MSDKIKILIVGHGTHDAELMHYELKKGGINFVSEIVENEKDYQNALTNFAPDIILSDYTLPVFDGATAFKIRKELAPDIPFIFVSGIIGEEISIELIKNGLTDYVLKNKLSTLSSKVQRALIESAEKRQKNITEQELAQSEKRLAKAQGLAHMGSWELDFATNNFRWSDEGCRIFGFQPQQNQQTFDTWVSHIHPDDRAFVLEKIKESKKYLSDFSYYYRIIRNDEEIRHIYSESKFEFDTNGKPVGMYGISHDVTKKRAIEAQMEFDRNNLDALINSTDDLMWSVDRDLNIITSNKPFNNMVKLITGSTIKKGINGSSLGFSEKKLEKYKKYYARAFTGESFTTHEYTNIPVEFWTEISFYPIRNEENVIGTACYARDITNKKISAQKLKQQNIELIKTNFELDRFVYSVSHDLRSPLTSVLGLITFIEEESTEPDTLEHTKMIRTRIQRLDTFIKNILNYSRNNRVELEVQEISIQKTIDEIVDLLRDINGAKAIDFEINIDEQQPFYSDLQRIKTILENLISNAIKFQKKEIPNKYIKITGIIDKNNLHLTIKDNGIGIAPKNHAKIFDIFCRLSAKIDGSGIGLYIVKESIEKLYGTIKVDSEEEIGTTFIIKIKNLIP